MLRKNCSAFESFAHSFRGCPRSFIAFLLVAASGLAWLKNAHDFSGFASR
jgi:hypothetical protein